MDFDVIPVVRELSADTLTPLVAFHALAADGEEAFLFESVERGENLGRYSFVGFEPRRNLTFDARISDPVRVLNDELVPLRVKDEDKLPPFFGGAVGYFGYNVSGWSERIPDSHSNDLGIPDAKLLFFDNVVVFDHVRQRMHVVANVFTKDSTIDDANARLDRAIARLQRAALEPLAFPADVPLAEFRSNHTRDSFEQMIREAKEEIVAGEIFQIVLSQRWETEYPTSEALTLYRTLRSINPSPYMFYFDFGDAQLVGASPEILVRREGDKVTLRPIAGTRKRGATPEKDLEMEQELLADPKERAEHLMLIDLGRNDVGRIAKTGTVKVTETMVVERYSHVMHMVSNVEGTVEASLSPMELLRATFPAGTVTGTPKVRAMEIIDELEPEKRGVYAGAAGYLGFNGNLDLAIAIRTGVVKDGKLHVQAAAGIVADSIPENEWRETQNKARAVLAAAELVQRGVDQPIG